ALPGRQQRPLNPGRACSGPTTEGRVAFKAFPIDHGRSTTELDPLRIFDSLTLRGSVNNPAGPQNDALHTRHAARAKPDVSVEMNTGGGKTLVGLLISMSLARELRRMVLYVSPTIQLVQQTEARARECGIEVATYYGREWRNEAVAASAAGPC